MSATAVTGIVDSPSGGAHREAALLHRLQVRAARDERDVVSAFREERPVISADPT